MSGLPVNQEIKIRLVRRKPEIIITPEMIHGFGDFRWDTEPKSNNGKTAK
jgi:hypothetical protein